MKALELFDWVTLRGRRINFGLIGGRVVVVFGGAKPFGSVTVDRLDAVVCDTEGVTADGTTLNVGALGIVLIVDHLAKIPCYARSPRLMHDRVFDLFSGSMFISEMYAATIRAALSLPDVGGDTTYFKEKAIQQMQSWSTDTVDVEVEPLKDALPMPIL